MTITGKHVEQVLRAIPGAYGSQVASVDELAAGATEALLTAPPGLTAQGAAAFLATLSQESGSFRYLTEAGSQAYLRSKTYYPYLGRTFEQVTHRNNYSDFGAWCHERDLLDDPEAFVKQPKKLADLEWAWLGGVWYWQVNDLWAYGNKGDFLATQQAVNLGLSRVHTSFIPSGIAERRLWYAAWLRIGADLIPTPTPTTTKGHLLMSTSAKTLYKRRTSDQVFPDAGQHQLEVDNKKPGNTSLVFGPNDAVDVTVGAVVTSEAGGVLRLVLVDVADGQPDVVHHARLGQSFPAGEHVEVLAAYSGSIGAASEKGHSLRLRAAVETAGPATVHDVQSTGFTL